MTARSRKKSQANGRLSHASLRSAGRTKASVPTRSGKAEGINCAAGRDRYTFLPIDRESHGRGIDRSSHLKMPQQLERGRVEGDEISSASPAEPNPPAVQSPPDHGGHV